MTDRAAEATLLRNLQSRQTELTTLLEEYSSHWGLEDPIYRFYHQSFKVYSLQDATARIVGVLESLAPDRPLNPWFRTIVAQGTGKSFTPAANADWMTTVTRPILEAFFHARFFLEMAARYATLRAHKIMRGFGDHLQYSVFECQLAQADLARCRHRLSGSVEG